MAKISEILSIEKERSDATTQQAIHLFKEGGFYRAYNWSAWLLVRMLHESEQGSDKRQLCVSRKSIKSSGDDFVFVGFPLKSMNKFIPQDAQFTPVNDSQIDVVINAPSADTELSVDDFEAWKQSIPISEKKKNTDTASSQPRQGLTALMSEVLKYPLESRTPLQNTEFISYLKQQLASLL